MVSGFNNPGYYNYARNLLTNADAMRQLSSYATMTHAKDAADYLTGASQDEPESLTTNLVMGGAFATAPWTLRALRHPIETFRAVGTTSQALKGVSVAGLPKDLAAKATRAIYDANRLSNIKTLFGGDVLASAKTVAAPAEARAAITKATENLAAAMKSGNVTEIARYTGELEGLVKATKTPGMFGKIGRFFTGKNVAASMDDLAKASEASGKAALETYSKTASKTAAAKTVGSKAKLGLVKGGAGFMAVFEGLFEAVNVWNTKKELGTGAAVKQTGKSVAKVGASVGGWVAGASAGGSAGAAIGGALGTIIPGVGNAIGAGVGYALGTIIGGFVGSWGAKKVTAAVVGEDELVLARKKASEETAEALSGNNPEAIAAARQQIQQRVAVEGETEEARKAWNALNTLESALTMQAATPDITPSVTAAPTTPITTSDTGALANTNPSFGSTGLAPSMFLEQCQLTGELASSGLNSAGSPLIPGISGSLTMQGLSNPGLGVYPDYSQMYPTIGLSGDSGQPKLNFAI